MRPPAAMLAEAGGRATRGPDGQAAAWTKQ